MLILAAEAGMANLPNLTVTSGSTAEMNFTDTDGTPIRWCVFGMSDPASLNPNPRFMTVESGPFKVINGTLYDSRVSFIGNLTVGKAWFRIANVNVNDSNTYKLRCVLVAGGFQYPTMVLEVLPGQYSVHRI
jgi:hypothetical protein